LKDRWDDERDPLAALRAGDRGPFEAFVARETRTFLGFFLRLGARREEAEDLTQEVFLKLYRSREGYMARERFAPYAFRVARNAWIDRRRRTAAQPRIVDGRAGENENDDERASFIDELPANAGGPERGLEKREGTERVHRALSELSAPHRAVFELGVLQELPYSEIAGLLSIPVGTVKSRMFQAVRLLRDDLAPSV
jgi:RNA polymerase sigma-70 factor (ECF subfamily)